MNGDLTGGIIIETEGYAGVDDKASHAFGGRRTKRTEMMYRTGGIAYIYLCYGMHSLLNAVTGPEEIPHAVLIRAIRPIVGLEIMMRRRNKKRIDHSLCQGPGSLTQALGITMAQNGFSLDSDVLWISDVGLKISQIEITPRIGVDYAEECATLPFRFLAK